MNIEDIMKKPWDQGAYESFVRDAISERDRLIARAEAAERELETHRPKVCCGKFDDDAAECLHCVPRLRHKLEAAEAREAKLREALTELDPNPAEGEWIDGWNAACHAARDALAQGGGA